MDANKQARIEQLQERLKYLADNLENYKYVMDGTDEAIIRMKMIVAQKEISEEEIPEWLEDIAMEEARMERLDQEEKKTYEEYATVKKELETLIGKEL